MMNSINRLNKPVNTETDEYYKYSLQNSLYYKLASKFGFVMFGLNNLKIINGIKNKNVIFPKKWGDITKTSKDITNFKNIATKTGKEYGITVFDFDTNKETGKCDSYEEFKRVVGEDLSEIGKACIHVVTPSGGHHFIMKYNSLFSKSCTDCFGIKGFDIKSNGGIFNGGFGYDVVNFEDLYNDPDIDNIDAEIELCIESFELDDVLNDFMYESLCNHEQLLKRLEDESKIVEFTYDKTDKSNKNDCNIISLCDIEKVELNMKLRSKIDEKITVEYLWNLLDALALNRSDNYKNWFTVSSTIKKYYDNEHGYKLFCKFSAKSPKYTSMDSITVWNNMKYNNITNIGSIINMLKTDLKNDPEKYKLIKKKPSKHDIKNKAKNEYMTTFDEETKDYYRSFESFEMFKLLCDGTVLDVDMAEYFIKKHNTFLILHDVMYHFNGVCWVKDNVTINTILADEFFHLSNFVKVKIDDSFDKQNKIENGELEDDEVNYGENIKKLQKTLIDLKKRLRMNSGLKAIIESIKSKITVIPVENTEFFDKQAELLVFTNGTYNLNTKEFRENRADDYITKFINYDYEYVKDDDDRMIRLMNYLKMIVNDADELQFLLMLLSTGLYNRYVRNIVILTGSGSNGKDSLITHLLKRVFSTLYFEGNKEILSKQVKSGACPELANINNKRFVIFNEPDEGKCMNVETLKNLTGCESVKGRDLFKSDDNVFIKSTLFILANDLPKLNKVDNAIAQRLIVFKFKAKFITRESLKNNCDRDEFGYDAENDEYYYEANNYYKSDEFYDDVKLAFLNLLIKSFDMYKNNGYEVKNTPESIVNNADRYMIMSDGFYNWFRSEYEPVDNSNEFLQIKTIFDDYKCSDIYSTLNRTDKRFFNRNWIVEEIKKNRFLKKNFKTVITRNNKQFKSVVINYRKIIDDYEDI